MSIRTKLAKPVNDVIRPLRVQLVPGTSPDPVIKDYIPARKTIAAAQKVGLSVGAAPTRQRSATSPARPHSACNHDKSPSTAHPCAPAVTQPQVDSTAKFAGKDNLKQMKKYSTANTGPINGKLILLIYLLAAFISFRLGSEPFQL